MVHCALHEEFHGKESFAGSGTSAHECGATLGQTPAGDFIEPADACRFLLQALYRFRTSTTILSQLTLLHSSDKTEFKGLIGTLSERGKPVIPYLLIKTGMVEDRQSQSDAPGAVPGFDSRNHLVGAGIDD